MTFLQLILLYFCTVVCALYLVSGGYKIIRNYIRKKIDAAAAEKISTGQAGGTKPEGPLIP
ncbi:DUF1378 family protein [Escherichia coli]|uniref:DUF1378 family protein n=1 Tax=Escherichia coli TaxID=562 RepID=UPI000D1263EB|nr:DUF1378 family protein [Escherichia coli]EED1372679.1 DUF1378 family protein [Escherichia coli]EED1928500.1 DUF1378 family protein [Escherichia coli]EEG9492631.1 DUF1378 family protein [Escherichia coli]EEQ1545166.1 DUF1378 family protein [Escherichia coli]EEQ2262919.1 DUF1378 family protein [Escherichia coli]